MQGGYKSFTLLIVVAICASFCAPKFRSHAIFIREVIMKNVLYVDSTSHAEIVKSLKSQGNAAHFTNGTYSYPAKMILPTTLAGFKRVLQSYPNLPLVIAVNSDSSMQAIGKTDFEPQQVRAEKVALPLAMTFPDNQVVVVYYDEETPKELYEALARHRLTRTLHKWGYGTEPNSQVIEGAQYFEKVFGLPLPNDAKPVCYDQTRVAEAHDNVIVEDLRNTLVDADGVLFPLPDSLAHYQSASMQVDTHTINLV